MKMKQWKELPSGTLLEEIDATRFFEEINDGRVTTFLGPLKHVRTGDIWAGVNVKCLEEAIESETK